MVCWAAASTAVSAVLYLFDFATNISTLRTYYLYEYHCPHASLASSALRDPICSAIHSNRPLHNIPFPFWNCLLFLCYAHFTYAIVFWLALDRRHHPLRFAYFLPLIHLYRLLKLLSHTLNGKDLKQLIKSQADTATLFNVIGASMETAPQFFLQFMFVIKLGDHLKGSVDLHTQKPPTNLIVSLVVSLLAGSYNTSMAVLCLIKNHMSLARRAYFSFLIGFHTLAAMLLRAMLYTAISQLVKSTLVIILLIYFTFESLIAWLLIDLLLQSNKCNGQGKSKYLRVAHSFGLALMTKAIGPTYVIVKFSKSPRLIIWGTLLYTLLELIGFFISSFLPSHFKELKSPCQSFHIEYAHLVEENKYLTCKALIAIFFLSLLFFILTALQLLYLQSSNNARVISSIVEKNGCGTHKKSTFPNTFIISKGSKGKNSHEVSATSFFALILFVVSLIFIHKLQKKYVLKGPRITL